MQQQNTTLRYQRLQELGWSPTILANATVMVVGAGALGNEVLKNLALLGVGTIYLCDSDKIELHNLTRTPLFKQQDEGKYKAELAAHRVEELNPDVKVHAITKNVQEAYGLGYFIACQIVFACVDNVQARLDINRYCYVSNTPMIDGGLHHLDGDIRIFAPPFSVCYDCVINDQMRRNAWQRYSCLKLRHPNQEKVIATAPTISAIVAGWQVQIAIKYLHNGKIAAGKRISILGNIDEAGHTQMSPNYGCPTHQLYQPIPLQKIEILPHLHTETTLVSTLLEYIAQHFTPLADIALNFDLITHLNCQRHQQQKNILRKRGTLFIDEAICQQCLQEQQQEAHALMSEHFINQIAVATKNPHLLNASLAQIGFAPCAVITAKHFNAENLRIEYRYYQIGKLN